MVFVVTPFGREYTDHRARRTIKDYITSHLMIMSCFSIICAGYLGNYYCVLATLFHVWVTYIIYMPHYFIKGNKGVHHISCYVMFF